MGPVIMHNYTTANNHNQEMGEPGLDSINLLLPSSLACEKILCDAV